jgi:hypothetical protein
MPCKKMKKAVICDLESAQINGEAKQDAQSRQHR